MAYQMHGLVTLDASLQVLRPAIIWCDSRAVEVGERAFRALGPDGQPERVRSRAAFNVCDGVSPKRCR